MVNWCLLCRIWRIICWRSGSSGDVYRPSVTTEELAKLCGLTPDSVYYHKKRLREKGVLIRKGGRKEGSWIIVEKK